jgi:hypothetical protein
MGDDTKMLERQLVFEDFADKVGEGFALTEEGAPRITLILREAEPLNPAMAPRGFRPPFTLFFVASDPRVMPQQIYRIEHEALGTLSIFLVPIGKDKSGVTYQATFN